MAVLLMRVTDLFWELKLTAGYCEVDAVCRSLVQDRVEWWDLFVSSADLDYLTI